MRSVPEALLVADVAARELEERILQRVASASAASVPPPVPDATILPWSMTAIASAYAIGLVHVVGREEDRDPFVVA